jgi:hypothetical protein
MRRILAASLSLAAAALAISISASAIAESTKIDGWISDSSCGAKHAGTGMACAKKCLEGGDKPVFVDEAKKEVWTIDNPDAVKSAYGKHVTITAEANAGAKSVHVTAVSVLGE